MLKAWRQDEVLRAQLARKAWDMQRPVASYRMIVVKFFIFLKNLVIQGPRRSPADDAAVDERNLPLPAQNLRNLNRLDL